MTYEDLVKDILFDGKDIPEGESARDILWGMTPFPWGTLDIIKTRLKEIRDQMDSGLTLHEIRIVQAEEMDAAHEEYKSSMRTEEV